MDRFEIEQAILNCWEITDDLKISSSPEYLAALSEVYEAKFNRLWSMFEEYVRPD